VETYLNSYEGVIKKHPSKERLDGRASVLQIESPTYLDILTWSKKWQELIGSDKSPRTPKFELLGQLAGKARALKALTRDRINHREDNRVISHVNDIQTIHSKLTKPKEPVKLSNRDLRNDLLLRQYARDAQLRFAGTLIRVCSTYLQTQNMGALLVALSFTRHLKDLATFVRIWKRALHLAVHLGCWEGPKGLQAMVSLLSKSIPPLWGRSTIGELLFAPPSNLLEDTLYVALGSSLQAGRGGKGQSGSAAKTVSDRTNEMLRLAREKPQGYRDWKCLFLPFTRSLSLPWRDALLEDR
jgi:hypothetical protein